MTGVVKSNRCGTCRKRKVKCDEAKPVCGPCQKGGRICEDPISKVKFTKPKEISGSLVRRTSPGIQFRAKLEPCANIAILRSTATEDGGSFQTMRIARPRRSPNGTASAEMISISPPLPLSPIESLQLALLDTFSIGQVGLRLSAISAYVKEIPGRLGHSAVLEDAMRCLAHIHTRLCHGQPPGSSPYTTQFYSKAILSLQDALRDPAESFSDDTLTAVAVIGQIELLGGGNTEIAGCNFVQHAGGATRMIEARGPETFQTDFSKLLLKCIMGNALVDALLHGKTSFLYAPEWHNARHLPLGGRMEEMNDQLESVWISMSVLIPNIRKIYESSSEADPTAVLKHAQQLRRSLQDVSEYVTESMENGVDIFELPSCQGDAFVPIVYDFTKRPVCNICVEYWGLSLILDTTIARLLPPHAPPSASEILNNRCIRNRHHIMMCAEYAEQFWPLGAMFVSGPLIIAFHGATPAEREWIVGKLLALGRHIPNIARGWNKIGLSVSIRFFFGEPIQVVTESNYKDTFKENMKTVGRDMDDDLFEDLVEWAQNL